MTKVEKLRKLGDIFAGTVSNIFSHYSCTRIFAEKILPVKEENPILYLKLLYAISEDIQFIFRYDKDPSIIDKVKVCLWE